MCSFAVLRGLLVSLFAAMSTGSPLPELAMLGLRYSDRPLDLSPPFSPGHYLYSARLDFADGSFSVDATPAEGVTISDSNSLRTAIPVDPGRKSTVRVKVIRAHGTDHDGNQTHDSDDDRNKIDYTVTVTRLDGKDVFLRSIEIPGGKMSPMFVPETTAYIGRFPAEVDRLRLRFVPWDWGQSFELLAVESKDDFEAVEQWTTTSLFLTTTFKPTFGVINQSQSVSIPDAKPVTTTTTTTIPVQCFDTNWKYGIVADMVGQMRSSETSPLQCQARCSGAQDCAHFTFWPDRGCHLQDRSASAFPAKAADDVISGPPLCQPPCFARMVYYGPSPNMRGLNKSIEEDAFACQRRCTKTTNCEHFTFWPDGGCHLQDGQSYQITTDHDTLAGPRECPDQHKGRRVLEERSLQELSPPGGRDAFVRALTEKRSSQDASGEFQYAVLERWFQFEVGQKRTVVINIRAANGDHSLSQTYRLDVVRASCPVERPHFAPDVKACVVTCNPGYFLNLHAGRCELCPSHCVECLHWDECVTCDPSDLREFRIIRLNEGRCEVLHVPWLRILASLVGGVVLLAFLCCCCGVGHPTSRRTPISPKFGGVLPRRRLSEIGGMGSTRLLPPPSP